MSPPDGTLCQAQSPSSSPGHPQPPGSGPLARSGQPEATAREPSCPEAPGTSGHTHPAPTHSQTRTPGRGEGGGTTQESGSQRGGRLEEVGWTAAARTGVSPRQPGDSPLRLVAGAPSVHFSPSRYSVKFGWKLRTETKRNKHGLHPLHHNANPSAGKPRISNLEPRDRNSHHPPATDPPATRSLPKCAGLRLPNQSLSPFNKGISPEKVY